MPESGVFSECKIGYVSSNKPIKSLDNVFGSRIAPTDCQEARFDFLSTWTLNFISSYCLPVNSHVFMEDYAFGAHGRSFTIGENGGVLKHKLWLAGYPISLVEPTVLKKFATGKGNAKKEQMHEAFFKKTNVHLIKMFQPKSKKVGSPAGDIVDGFYLADYGRFISDTSPDDVNQ